MKQFLTKTQHSFFYFQKLWVILTLLFITDVNVLAQSCVPTNINGTVINLTCSQPCTNLNFQVAHLKSTDEYIVNSIPYAPYPYVTATGIELTDIYVDDSSQIRLAWAFLSVFMAEYMINVLLVQTGS